MQASLLTSLLLPLALGVIMFGLGLGLTLSQSLAEAMGGSLQLHDAGPGACFALRLPVHNTR